MLDRPDLDNVANAHAAELYRTDLDAYTSKTQECRVAILRIMQGQPPHAISPPYDPFAVAYSRLPRQATVPPPQDARRPLAIPSWEDYRAGWNTLGTTLSKAVYSEQPNAPHVSYDENLRQPSSRPTQPMSTLLAPSVRSLPSTAGVLDGEDLVTWSFNLDDEFGDL